MAKSINRKLAELIEGDGTTDLGGGGTTYYDTLDSLPVTELTAGNTAFVEENRRLYVSDGSGWYNASFVNRGPRWDSGGEPNASYQIADSATPLIITARAIDSDNVNFINQAVASDSAQYMVDISIDSSVFTFTPKSADSIGASVASGDLTDSNGDFIYTFKWSDGINFVSKAVTITYNLIADLVNYGDRAIFFGGSGGATNQEIDYVDITTLGNASDFGDLTEESRHGAAASNSVRGMRFGGRTNDNTTKDTIDYVTIASPGNATDFANLTGVVQQHAGFGDGTYAFAAGGGTSNSSYGNVIQRWTVDTTSDASDFGDQTITSRGGEGVASKTRGVWNLGQNSVGNYINTMEYITTSTPANSTDFGDMVVIGKDRAAGSNQVYGIFANGYSNAGGDIDRITIETTGNATDFGNIAHSEVAGGGAGAANATRMIYAGGNTPSPDFTKLNIIEYVTIATPGNGTDFGDLTAARNSISGGTSGKAA